MHRPPLVRLGAALAVVLALAGCDGGGVATTPVPSISPILPTTSGTAILPSASPSGTPSLITVRPTTSAETEALAAEAEQVYVAYMTLRLKYEAQGGIAGPLPEDLKKYVAGEEAITAQAVLAQAHELGYKLTGTENLRIVRGPTFTEGLLPEALIGVQFCDDNSGITVSPPEEEPGPAVSLQNRPQFARGADGELRVIDNLVTEVESCA